MQFTNLANVKTWLNLTTSDSDALIGLLINRASGFVANYIQRQTLVKTTYNELRSGVGGFEMMLRNWPVLSVSSVVAGNTTIPARPNITSNGYTLGGRQGGIAGAPQSVILTGYNFQRGGSNVQIDYIAGNCVQGEARTVPASTSYTITPYSPNGMWAQDDGVTLANGTALTAITTGSPAANQYVVTTDASTGVVTYTFNVAQASAAVLLSYSFIPDDIVQATTELVGERFRVRDRIGQTSHSANGVVTTGFSQKDFNDFIRDTLQPYRSMVPIA